MEENYFANINTKTIGRKVLCHKKVTSTNDLGWLEISRGAEGGTVILAEEQLKGRGRFGRDWFSPARKGIWLSVVLYPSRFPEETFILMSIGAIAVADLLKNKFNLPASIRWPNDVIINNKKIAGIIVESRYINKSPNATVMGIGLNIDIPESEIPADLKDITTSLTRESEQTSDIKIELITIDLICLLDKWYHRMINQELKTIQDAWRNFSGVLNKPVSVKIKDRLLKGTIVDLDPCKGFALLEPDGQTNWWRGETVEMLRLI
ncbi:MAG TPA: biotin--[acetyl-CoA-carboxylase] ligase [Planctomycetota bacterium]|nr:biotin--[acetyl-CoA-carboxylase] ligase [Planctomycetota bacterium]